MPSYAEQEKRKKQKYDSTRGNTSFEDDIAPTHRTMKTPERAKVREKSRPTKRSEWRGTDSFDADQVVAVIERMAYSHPKSPRYMKSCPASGRKRTPEEWLSRLYCPLLYRPRKSLRGTEEPVLRPGVSPRLGYCQHQIPNLSVPEEVDGLVTIRISSSGEEENTYYEQELGTVGQEA